MPNDDFAVGKTEAFQKVMFVSQIENKFLVLIFILIDHIVRVTYIYFQGFKGWSYKIAEYVYFLSKYFTFVKTLESVKDMFLYVCVYF